LLQYTVPDYAFVAEDGMIFSLEIAEIRMFHSIKQFLLLAIFILVGCSTVYKNPNLKETKEVMQKDRRREAVRSAIDPLLDTDLERLANEKSSSAIMLALPLSGKNSPIGRSILAACLLAQQELNHCDVDMYVVDSSDKNLDMHQVYNHFRSRNLRAIIGPVFYGEIKKFSALFPSVPLFTLSNNEKGKNNHVFVCGLAPKNEIKQLFLSMKLMGIDGLFVALPNGKFGDTLLKYFKKECGEDWDMEVMRYDFISLENARKCVKNSTKSAVFALDPLFNAQEKTQTIARDNGWVYTDDYRSRAVETRNYAHKKIFTLSSCALAEKAAWNGAFFAFAKNDNIVNFSARYKEIFSQDPSILNIIAYDLSKIILLKIFENGTTTSLDGDTNKNIFVGDFSGCLGKFMIHKKHGMKRKLSTLRHTNGQDVVIH
jgi:hypothetical protein